MRHQFTLAASLYSPQAEGARDWAVSLAAGSVWIVTSQLHGRLAARLMTVVVCVTSAYCRDTLLPVQVMGLNVLGCRLTHYGQVNMIQYCFTSTETRRLVRTDSRPGRPPQLSLTQLLN